MRAPRTASTSPEDAQLLLRAGLTQGECKVYLALLEIGACSIGPLLRKSGVTKSIIYRILDKLIQKGLASYVVHEKTRRYQAAPPGRILDYIESRERDLHATAQGIRSRLPALLAKAQQAPASKATIFEGFSGMASAFERLYSKLGRGDEYFFFGLPSEQPQHYHAYWQKDHARRARAGIRVRMLYNPGVGASVLKNRNRFPLCDARRMPFDIDTPSWVMGYKDTTLLCIPLAKTPLTVEIVSQEVADSFKAYFEEFWKRSRKFTG